MSKVWMMWHGGINYSVPDSSERRDCEEFASLKEARDEFADRACNPRFPCVETAPPDDGGPEGFLYLSDPFDGGADCPDYVLRFGPRGGVQQHRA